MTVEAKLLQLRLRTVGRRLFAVRTLGSLGWAVISAFVLVLVAVWLDLLWELPAGMRITTVIAAPTLGLALLGHAAWQTRRRGTPDAVAQQLDDVSNAGGRIRTGVDLLAARGSSLSDGLAVLAVADASALASRVPAARVAPLRLVMKPFLALAAFAVIIGGACAAFPRLAAAEWNRFLHPFGDEAPFSRVVFHVEPGDTQVIYGQPLDVRATVEGPPVERLNLVLETDGLSEEVLPMFAESGGSWRATVANVTTPVRYHVRSHAGRSAKFTVRVITVPRLEAIRFRVTPPAYTNRPPYEGPLPKGGLAGLVGTRVEVWATSNRPLAAGTIRFTPPGTDPIALASVSAGASEVTGSFEIRTPGQIQLKITDLDGQESTDAFTAPVSVLTDERPIVRLIEPRDVSIATPTATIPVSIAAEDDYGVARVQLFRSLNDSRALPLDVAIKLPPPTRVGEVVYLPLASYGLEPGDEIKLFARAEDNDPAGAKGAESSVAVIRIISQEDFEKMVQAREGLELLQAKYQQARRRLEGLAEEGDELRKKRKDRPKDAAATASDREDLQKLANRARAEAAAIRAAAKKQLGYDLDRHLTPQLERLERELEKRAKELEALANEKELTEEQIAEALKKLAGQLDSEKQAIDQNAIAALERLGAVMPVLEDSSRFVALVRRQRDLATRLQALKDQEKPRDPAVRARMRDLRAEQEEIRAALGKLLDDIEEHVTRLPDDAELDELRASARKFVADVRGCGATEAMNAAEAGLSEFSGKLGHANADKAAELLEKFIERAEGGSGMMGQGMKALRFQPGLAAGLGNTVEQMLGEAGLLPGTGMGGNGTGGSSARRNANIGLYGALPGLGESSGLSSVGGGGSGRPGSAPRSGSQPGVSVNTPSGKSPGATGSGEAAIPPAYRRRVAEYFQRVADETGK